MEAVQTIRMIRPLEIKEEMTTLDLEINFENQIQLRDGVPIHLLILGEKIQKLYLFYNFLDTLFSVIKTHTKEIKSKSICVDHQITENYTQIEAGIACLSLKAFCEISIFDLSPKFHS